MNQQQSLPLSKQITYALGQLGWSILVNIISLQLVYFYIPPENAGIPQFITGATFLGVLNAVTLIAASGRLLDAVTDPLIANLSDQCSHPQGRRIPFLMYGALPAALFCLLSFLPPVIKVSPWNIVWLVIMQALFYVFLTAYVTPYFALLPELANSTAERLNLSTWISITYALGLIVASQVPWLGNLIYEVTPIEQKFIGLQFAVGIVSLIAVSLMYIPILTINEREYCSGQPTKTALKPALSKIIHNQNFRYYVIADFAYFTGLTIINTGLLYYITVLLLQQENLVGIVTSLMVIISFFFYPLVNLLAKKVGKKILITISFIWMGILFTYIIFLGRLPFSSQLQAYLLAALQAVPLAFLGVLPNAVLADIAEHNTLQTGEQQEGMFFAARTFMQKIGQTCGVFIFAALTTLGKDPGSALGIRLSGLFGMLLCITAGLIFTNYQENKILTEISELKSDHQ